MAEGTDLVVATLVASVAERLTRDHNLAEVPQALVDLYLDVKQRLEDATKRPPTRISKRALERMRQLTNPRI
jgi:hypothetical protein